jgi:prepilin-type N-terminal cleavage/methylation domain-containing protein
VSNKRTKSGLTLVELLIAMAMVVAILSMVNAGFFAASRSAEYCTDKMTLDWRQALLLDNIAGQLRCAFALPDNPDQIVTASSKPKTACFEYNIAGNTLHFLTTRQFDSTKDPGLGLLDVTYKFDSARGALFLSERRFVETSGDTPPQWRQIAENIRDIHLEFFDGRQWLERWDRDEQKNLPSAVRITIKYQRPDLRRQQCSTTAFVCLAADNRQATQVETDSKKTK